MGRQVGLVHVTGQFGDMKCSIGPNGKGIVSFAPVKKGKVKKGANFALTRENNAEFKGSAYSASSLRRCMGERIRQFADRDLQSRLLSLTYDVIAMGPGRGGQRSFEVMANQAMFLRLEANDGESLQSRFSAPYTVAVNTDRNTATLDVPSFETDNFLTRPQGATHFRLVLVAGVLSDFTFVGGKLEYAAVNGLIDGLSILESSVTLPAVHATNATLQLVAALPGLPVLPATAGLVVSVGIEYLRVINNFEEVMAQGSALRVMGVY